MSPPDRAGFAEAANGVNVKPAEGAGAGASADFFSDEAPKLNTLPPALGLLKSNSALVLGFSGVLEVVTPAPKPEKVGYFPMVSSSVFFSVPASLGLPKKSIESADGPRLEGLGGAPKRSGED